MLRDRRIEFVRIALCAAAIACVWGSPNPSRAATPAKPAVAASPAASGAPAAYDTFATGATLQPGLIPLLTKGGNVYFVVSKAQLTQPFIETSVPSTGLGGFGPAAGEPYVAPARIFRFERVGDRVVLSWPNTYAQVTPDTPESTGATQSLPSSIIAVEPIVAEDKSDGTVVISTDPFLGDVADYAAVFQDTFGPQHAYQLDPRRSFLSESKALPENDILRVRQTWATSNPDTIDNAPDPRSLEVRMTYNIIAVPNNGYMPRIADPRVGYFEVPLLNFSSDQLDTRNVDYVSRWNFAPAAPGKPSAATHPLVFYISNDVPVVYRKTVEDALLTWNSAFSKIGILNAISVQQQPDDPSWDPDDIRHNMVRWVDTTDPQYGAEALIVNDPRTGEELNVGVNVDAIEGLAGRTYRFLIAPARGLPDSLALERHFTLEAIRATVLHESGHDLGLQHNFIGALAYTAQDLQSKAFTQRYGVASSVMEYSPLNLWPKGTPQGDYEQTVLGPYDYYAIRYGYAYVSGASSPQQELPALDRWASGWANPRYRFASDEDVDFYGGHAIDPRVVQFDLTNHPLAWCQGQTVLMQHLMSVVARRFPQPGHDYDQARLAFLLPFNSDLRCAGMAAHTIGGEYVSRARKGDPDATLPLQAVSRAENYRAWQLLSNELFSDRAWHFNPLVLRMLTYSEVSSFTDATWAYNPTPRHDVPIAQTIAAAQERALNEIFAPLTLQRIDDLSMKYRPGTTITLSDIFNWANASIFGDIASGDIAKSSALKRNLQIHFAERLARMWTFPSRGAPTDAQTLARAQLVTLSSTTQTALRRYKLDDMARAQLEELSAIANQALHAQMIVLPQF